MGNGVNNAGIGGSGSNQNMHNQNQHVNLNSLIQEINIPPELLSQPNFIEELNMQFALQCSIMNKNINNNSINNINSSENGRPNTISDTNPFRSTTT
ncbi:8671_t:CDS:1, partial [Ambispora leptoticha]